MSQKRLTEARRTENRDQRPRTVVGFLGRRPVQDEPQPQTLLGDETALKMHVTGINFVIFYL